MEGEQELRDRIGDEAYRVTQEQGTEMPFTGRYNDEKAEGMYKCIVCGAELFDSKTKFNSGSGWPSFYDVANSEAVELKEDISMGMARSEVVCKNCGAHLGHVFPDAIDTPTGDRYCINSCAIDLEKKDNKEKNA